MNYCHGNSEIIIKYAVMLNDAKIPAVLFLKQQCIPTVNVSLVMM